MNEIFPFKATGMDLEGTMVHEMSDRERQMLYDITYVEALNNNKLVNKTKKKKQTHRYREQTNDYQWGRGERGGRRDNIGIGRKKVIMRLYEIMYVKLLKAVKHYTHSGLNTC